MEAKTRHIELPSAAVNVCRFVLGAVFVFSGFVKAVDPTGSFYKIQDYLTAFGIISLFPEQLPMFVGMALAALEFCVGICLLFGIRKRAASALALLLMVFMTPLTLYLAIANPVSDCGCFGDALVLSNWQTFGKNVILLLAAIVTFAGHRKIVGFMSDKTDWALSLYSFLFILALMAYCLYYLPIMDFRPYKIGNNIREEMSMPDDAKPSVYKSIFTLEKDGEQREFTLDDYPDSTWTFVKAENVLVEKGYEPAIKDFSLQDLQTGEDITDAVLADTTYTFLLVAHRVESAEDSNIDRINQLYDYSLEHGYGFYALTSSSESGIEEWRDRTGAEYPFCFMDDIALKTIVRSNPGMLLIKDGTILNKWSHNALPDEEVIAGDISQWGIASGHRTSTIGTLMYVALWFVVPLLLFLGIDVVVKRRHKDEKINV